MDLSQVSRDDLFDVMEMTQKIESAIDRVLRGNEKTLGMSALMSATVNCILSQCSTIQEIHMYRNIFMQILDSTILNIKIKDKDKD